MNYAYPLFGWFVKNTQQTCNHAEYSVLGTWAARTSSTRGTFTIATGTDAGVDDFFSVPKAGIWEFSLSIDCNNATPQVRLLVNDGSVDIIENKLGTHLNGFLDLATTDKLYIQVNPMTGGTSEAIPTNTTSATRCDFVLKFVGYRIA